MTLHLFVHVSWTTHERSPMITPAAAGFLRRFLPAEARRHRTGVVAMGMVSDHVHLLLRVQEAFHLPRLVQGFKGASSRLLNADPTLAPMGLRWARGYDARSVAPGAVRRVAAYVRGQVMRHPERAISGTRNEAKGGYLADRTTASE
jgi:REP element-mobilizing transposase RayT